MFARVTLWTTVGAALLIGGCEVQPLQRADRPPPSLFADPTTPPPAPPTAGGYWVSADMVGPAAAQQAVAAELGEGLPLRDPADVMPPGVVVGHLGRVQATLRWMERFAFEPRPRLPAHPRALQRNPAPAPAGGLLDRHGATVVAFVISGATTELRPRTIAWPQDQLAILPTGSTWLPAALVPHHAPLFAAPAPTVPPADHAHGVAHRRGGLFVLGWVDRCDATPSGLRCLRWAQVVARDGDRFSPGYVPNTQVAVQAQWVRGQGQLPRAQLVELGVSAGQAQWMLLARSRDNQLHRRTLHAPTADDGWPRASLHIEGDLATVTLGDAPPVVLALDATLDARPSKPTAEPAG